ncbi:MULTISPECIES: DUF11 domain-containing protein [unclassified Polaromonas]|uniref:DUF11 domain-containing protein n=1 Tax=unclassified Polaromonas TaxID=2638319 RepID=UPI0018CA1815|nr:MULTISPECIES: DUF11 domain-containing protein [unclassified Polaromonas]MBG6074036.1 putative repeat protein (TIGR01451 family) [Polaromonas sp. CG_9.7]MBG6116047.1 putative repeat protein (TIGR01451 family) [Polaromonas sp. CG_9.2]MDH6182623.1 putative repeat protein (TIGR01451 family) [Polaromonas sp. CG_23.6]
MKSFRRISLRLAAGMVQGGSFFKRLLRGWPGRTGLMVAVCFVFASASLAASAPAGTLITNSATLTYSSSGGLAQTLMAVAAVVMVAKVIDLTLTWQDASSVPVNSPDPGKALNFLLTNTGNGTETFQLARNNQLAGDQFDPANAAAGAIYLESGAQAGLQATGPNADILYQPGMNEPVLAASASRNVYVYSSIGTSLPVGALGKVSLSASSATPGAPGALPGTRLTGLGQGGVQTVVGGSRGQASALGSYIVSGISLNLIKTVTAVHERLGGSLVMPGSVLTYRIVLTLTGSGIAENFSFADPLPASITYLPGSMTVDGIVRGDTADTGSTNKAGFAAGTVSVLFGNTPVPATHVIEFKVTIN